MNRYDVGNFQADNPRDDVPISEVMTILMYKFSVRSSVAPFVSGIMFVQLYQIDKRYLKVVRI